MRVYSVLDAMRDDHGRIVALMNAIVTPSRDLKKKKEQYRDLRRELTVHTLFEEEMVYPKVRQVAGYEFFVTLGAVHHKSLDTYINRLDKLPVGGPDWVYYAQRLREDTLEHIRVEERELAAVLKMMPVKIRSRAG